MIVPRRTILVLALAFNLTQGAVFSVHEFPSLQEVYEQDRSGFYEQTLDRVFPREKFDQLTEGRLIILRIMPAFYAESQLIIREMADGRIILTYYELADKQSSIHSHINDVQSKNQNGSVDQVVASLRIKIKTIDPGPELRRALHELPEIRTPKNIGGVMLDAQEYEIWVDSGNGSLHLLWYDGWPSHNTKVDPIAEWMVKVSNLAQAATGIESIKTGGRK